MYKLSANRKDKEIILVILFVFLSMFLVGANGQTLPLEIRQDQTLYNFQSKQGVPISTVSDASIGSDGRAPSGTSQQAANLTINPPTSGQFSSLLSWGAVAAPDSPGTVSSPNIAEINGSITYAGNAANLGLPHGGSGASRIVLQRAQVGAPFLNRPVSFLFGGIISPPEENEDSGDLPNGVLPNSYWLGEPHLLASELNSGHTAKGYYYSPHARSVFAIQPGPIEITWRKAVPYEGEPSDKDDATKWHLSGGYHYRLYKKRYIVSGSAAKTPRKIYWNQAGYPGPQVNIPTTTVGDIHIVYNSSFPENVDIGTPAMTLGATSSGDNNNEPVYKYTLRYDNGSLKALNAEGRVFVELLGDLREDGNTRQHLGFEIVDVFKHSTPATVLVELGDKVEPTSPPVSEKDELLHPEPLLQVGAEEFTYRTGGFGGSRIKYYAVRETRNLNDYQIHWMEEGLEGIRWPARHVRYNFRWPENPARYSHYVRPTVIGGRTAESTAVKLPLENVPFIQYQDALDRPRAFLSSTYEFYTDLDEAYPQHRTLIRFNSGENIYFERVFSWLESSLKAESLDQSSRGLNFWVPARDLSIWGTGSDSDFSNKYEPDADTAVKTLNPSFINSDNLNAPRYIAQSVNVGSRIIAPTGELGSNGADYLAGYILQEIGDSFNPNAYIDPISEGFEKANLGSIIPVNADPGNNILEVYWFRQNSADQKKGFKPTYWPAAFGRYTITWPSNPREIVLASNDGTGALSSLEAKGSIYYQNDDNLPGYNPNEEHAIMLAGQAYALRDDLNITDITGYTSHPRVLLAYTDSDGRPSMSVFNVLREKPSQGILFDYITEAGQMLQAPMPLPLLAKPVSGTGSNRINYNSEPPAPGVEGDSPVNASGDKVSAPSAYSHYNSFTYEDRKGNHWVYRGLHAGAPNLEFGSFTVDASGNASFSNPSNAIAKVGEDFSYTIHASRRASTLKLSASSDTPLPTWLNINGLKISGKPTGEDIGLLNLALVLESLDGAESISANLQINVSSDTDIDSVGQGPMNHSYTESGVNKLIGDRPPSLAQVPNPENSFKMKFYYRTLAGFAWPGINSPPAEGSIVPYLLPANGAGGFTGDPTSADTASLEIIYRPVWPANTPVMNLSETLTNPKKGLPAVRGQSSLKVLYQQSIANKIDDGDNASSVTLHDPTREKVYDLAKIPASVKTSSYLGKLYFPNLPPYLSQRIFYDANRGEDGKLVFGGKFVDEPVGEKYLLLNVLNTNEINLIKNLCASDDPDKGIWDSAVGGLVTRVETFYEPAAYEEETNVGPGQWVPNTTISDKVGLSGDKADKYVEYGVESLVKINHDDSAVDSYALSANGPGVGYVTLISNDGNNPEKKGLPISVHIIRVGKPMYRGETKVLYASNPMDEQVTFQHTADLAAKYDDFDYEWMIQPPVDGSPPKVYYTTADSSFDPENPKALASGWTLLDNGSGPGLHRYTLGGSGIQTLSDNYIIMRYRPKLSSHPGYVDLSGAGLTDAQKEAAWSDWTEPQLAEGWIKRVLAGINPFGQRVTDLFNNSVNTDASMLTQAGKRWEGDIALNLDNIDDHGLLEIYETVLNRGKMLSIEAGINYGPANDALLLAAGYINDLYMMVGNEAWADASNPTIGIGTKDRTYGDIATALFSFKGQVPSLLEEELALLRGRDDFMQPGVETGPVYNRLFWNYTRGIDSGEVIYALNYNIQEDQGNDLDGAINAADAARMFPQGHGDAYGHYLSALKGYYKLITDVDFTWAPRTEAVTVLGKPVQVDYMDERKFAAAAVSLARAGNQIFDLTWRRDYEPGKDSGWNHFDETRVNERRSYTEGDSTIQSKRKWGMDHWASRTGIGTMVNWVVGNAMLPDEDNDPSHEGIQKIDRTTVPELEELTTIANSLQTSLDNAEGHLTPLGLPEDSLAFDINPNKMAGNDIQTHYEQIANRARVSLSNAISAFDDSKDVTRLMRSEEDSLADLQSSVAQQELAYMHQLIELYGTPYPSDIGPGKTYPKDYNGPDLVHFMYPEMPEKIFPETWSYTETNEIEVIIRDVPDSWLEMPWIDVDWPATEIGGYDTIFRTAQTATINIGEHGFPLKPNGWDGKRSSPGELQQAMSDIILIHRRLRQAVNDAAGARNDFRVAEGLLTAQLNTKREIREKNRELLIYDQTLEAVTAVNETMSLFFDSIKEDIVFTSDAMSEAIPGNFVVGLASGGDLTSAGRSAVEMMGYGFKKSVDVVQIIRHSVVRALDIFTQTQRRWGEFDYIQPRERIMDVREAVYDLTQQVGETHAHLWTINEQLRKLEDARAKYRALMAKGERIQLERANFRKRSAAVVQGFRTRDAAFRIFRNEKLERYKTLFDIAAKYTYLSAKAYDYETGLLHTKKGKDFVKRIVNSRALGVVKDGKPQYAASNTGDPGLSSILSEMQADWNVLKGRLGFNNPDTYGTTVSMRNENYRILPGADGIDRWRDVLESARKKDILQDSDVARYCLQIDSGDGLPVSGIVLEFSTTVSDGLNLFGKSLGPADSNFSPSSFANKIHAVGVSFEGYKGISNPNTNSAIVGGLDGDSPSSPGGGFLDPNGLAATPYVYLIPIGVDSMRSPPLGDASAVRSWNINDVAVPMPFNIGGSDLNEKKLWQSPDSLSEELFGVRKHQAFRAVSSTEVFKDNSRMFPDNYTNSRLIGRSVWNSRWKLVIPGRSLLNDSEEGLDRFIRTVKDIKIYFNTYSYSGN